MARTTATWTVIPAALATAALLTGCDEKMVAQIDNTPPEASIASPADGSGVSGVSFEVTVSATDDVAMGEVRFRVNGGATVVDTEAPFSLVVITLPETAGGAISVDIEAFDLAGNSASAGATYSVQPRTITRLTNHPNDDMNPAWSPDGQRIAFQAKRSGDQFDLWSMDADGANATQLTADVNEDRNPAWSPDGSRIAFDSDRAGTFDIWLLPLAGGEAAATSLTFGNKSDIQPAWTPDGADLYFASDRGSNTPFNIWRAGAGGSGNAVQVTSFDDDDTAPAVSPNGLTLAFVSTLNLGSDHVYTRAVGSSAVTALTGSTGFVETDPAWVPGGGGVVFSRDDGLDSNLWIQPMEPNAAPVQATFGSGNLGDGGAAWSPDGSRLAFHSDRDGNLEIYVVE